MKDHYEILGVNPGSTQDEIKKAYRLLALRHHPDRNGGTRQSEEFFKQIVESYQVLSDVSSRRSYDYWRFPKDSDPYENTEPGKVTPATFLRIFKTIREKVVNADIYVSESSLFELINGVLTTENLNYLVGTADIRTNGFIIDEIVTASVFLEDSSKMVIYRKLIRLAHGDEGLRKKVSALSNVEYAPRPQMTEEKETEELSDYVYFFIAMMIAIVLFAVISGIN